MDVLSIEGVAVKGIVACLPQNKVDTEQSCLPMYGASGVKTLIKATGIESKRIASVGTTSLDLCVYAANELLKKTQTKLESVGAVICVTFTPEHIMPADAPSAQHRLGLSKEILAFDINMACSGYGYGLYVAGLLAKQLKKNVLLLDGDVQSAYLSNHDKSTAPVMADAGTATLVAPSNDVSKWNFSFYTDGEKCKSLYIPAGGSKQKTSESDIVDIEYEDGSRRKNTEIYMDGFEIFKFVALPTCKFIKTFMEDQHLSDESIDIFVPHQANIYMITELTKKLKISKEKMWKSGDKYGNPSSASVPLTIAENAAKWFSENRGSRMLFSGFGGGLSASVGKIDLNKDACYSVVEYNGG